MQLLLFCSSKVSLSSVNAVNCAKSIIKIIKHGINSNFNQYDDYPEINVIIGGNIGENTVIHIYIILKLIICLR